MFNETEINIGADGKTRKLVGTTQNIFDIEANVGAIAYLINKTRSGGEQLKYKEMIDIIYYGLNGNGDNRLEKKSIENELFRLGYIKLLGPVVQWLYLCTYGGEAQEKGDLTPEVPASETIS